MTPGEIAQLTATVALITAVVSSITAVVVTLMGQYLTRRYGNDADRRRWEREDASRRRVRGEEIAREMRQVLLEATGLFEAAWVRAKPRGMSWEDPPAAQLDALAGRAMSLSIEIPDDEVRIFARQATSALLNTDDAFEAGGPEPYLMARSVAAETDSVVGAYLRGERIPAAPETKAIAEAAGEWQAQISAWQEEQHAARVRERAETAKAAASSAKQDDTTPVVVDLPPVT